METEIKNMPNHFLSKWKARWEEGSLQCNIKRTHANKSLLLGLPTFFVYIFMLDENITK